GAALTELSDVLLGLGEIDGSLAAARESVDVHARLNDTAASASAWNALGNVHWLMNEMDAALDEFRRSGDLATSIGDRAGVARTLNNIANVLKYRDRRSDRAGGLRHRPRPDRAGRRGYRHDVGAVCRRRAVDGGQPISVESKSATSLLVGLHRRLAAAPGS